MRSTSEYILNFIAGFISTTSFAFTRINKFPFAEGFAAIEKDRFEVKSDLKMTSNKLKNNAGQQTQT